MKDELTVLAYSNGFCLWLLKSVLNAEDIKKKASTYFDQFSNRLKKNDLIMLITIDNIHLKFTVNEVDNKNKRVIINEQ